MEETYYLEFNRLITDDDLAIAIAHGLMIHETYERAFFARGVIDANVLEGSYSALERFDILPQLEPVLDNIQTVHMVYDGPNHYTF